MVSQNMCGSGKALRLARILSGPNGRAACLAFDHGLHIGPIPGNEKPGEMIDAAIAAQLDGILLSPGLLHAHADRLAGRDKPAIILRLDQTSMWRIGRPGGYATGHTRAIATVEDAVRMGADAVITYVFTSHNDPALEDRSVDVAATAAQDARRLGIPMIMEPMAARGGLIEDVADPAVIAANTRMAMELGADIVKTDWSNDVASFAGVVETAGVPILVAGGPQSGGDADVIAMVDDVLAAGAAGILFGRQLIQASDPAGVMRAARDKIHGTASPATTAGRRRTARKKAAV